MQKLSDLLESAVKRVDSNSKAVSSVNITHTKKVCSVHSCDGYISWDNIDPAFKSSIDWPEGSRDILVECPIDGCPARVYGDIKKHVYPLFRETTIDTAIHIMSSSDSWNSMPRNVIATNNARQAAVECVIAATRWLLRNVVPKIWMPHRKISAPNIIVTNDNIKMGIDIDLAIEAEVQVIYIKYNRGPVKGE